MHFFRTKSVARFLAVGAFVSAVVAGHAAPTRTVVVVISPKNPISNKSLADLRKIFAGDKRVWPNGVRVKLFPRSPGTMERTALLTLLGKSEPNTSSTGPARSTGERRKPNLWSCPPTACSGRR